MTINFKRIYRILRVWYYRGKLKINRKLFIYIVFVIISTILWFINKTGSTIVANLNYDVEYFNLPKDKLISSQLSTNKLEVKVSAIGSVLMGLPSKMPPMRIDLSKIDAALWIESEDSAVKLVVIEAIKNQIENQLPQQVKFIDINPDTICLEFGQSLVKRVPVKLDAEISYASQFRNSAPISFSPDSVEIIGSVKIVDTIKEINNEFLKIKDLQENFSRRLKLLSPEGVVCSNLYADLNINVEKFTEETLELTIRQINVPDSITMRIFPPVVKLSFNVGWKNYGRASSDMFSVVVDYKDVVNQTVKPDVLFVKLMRKPDLGLSDIKIRPESVEFLIEQNSSANDNPIEIIAEKK